MSEIDTVRDSLQLLAGEINKRKFTMESSVKLRQEFYRLSKIYRKLELSEGGETAMAEVTTPVKSDDVLVRSLKKSVLTLLLMLRHTPEKLSEEQKSTLLEQIRDLIK